MKKIAPSLTLLVVFVSCLWLSGCGYHLRNSSDFPQNLQLIYLDQPKTDSNQLVSSLIQFLESMNVTVVDDPSKAPIQLKISNIHFSSNFAALSSGSEAITVTYRLDLTLQLLNKHSEPLTGPKVITVSEAITQNSSQINTSSNSSLMQKEMNRDAITRINAWLLSDVSQDAITQATDN